MKTSVYIATAIITLSTLSTAGFLAAKNSSHSVPASVQAEQTLHINWGEGVDVQSNAERRQEAPIARTAQN